MEKSSFQPLHQKCTWTCMVLLGCSFSGSSRPTVAITAIVTVFKLFFFLLIFLQKFSYLLFFCLVCRSMCQSPLCCECIICTCSYINKNNLQHISNCNWMTVIQNWTSIQNCTLHCQCSGEIWETPARGMPLAVLSRMKTTGTYVDVQ